MNSTQTMAEPTTSNSYNQERKPPYTIYKANKRGDGGAITFSFNKAKGAVFVEAANQSGDKQFDWDNKIIMKWGIKDLGAILAGLQGKEPQTKLFHKTDKANSACSLTSSENPDHPPFLLTISRQDALDKQVRKVTISISLAEVVILETALRTAISRILGW